jgi:hypothetical protein
MTGSPACERCGQAYTPRSNSSDDPLCPACREQVAAWHSDARLTALAQQGFDEAMGLRPRSVNQFPGLPDDAQLHVHRLRPGAGMPAQQVTAWPDGTASIGEAVPDYVIVPGQVRCRHCAAAITAGPDGAWADASGSAACFSPDVPHAPLPPWLDGSTE